MIIIPKIETGIIIPGVEADNDPLLAANSDTKLITQQAAKSYADSKLAKDFTILTEDLTPSGFDKIAINDVSDGNAAKVVSLFNIASGKLFEHTTVTIPYGTTTSDLLTIFGSYPKNLNGKELKFQFTNSTAKYLNASAIIDLGDGTVKINCTGHGFVEGDIVHIDGTTNYNGRYILPVQTSGDVDNFVITSAFVSETPAVTAIARKPFIMDSIQALTIEGYKGGNVKIAGNSSETGGTGLHTTQQVVFEVSGSFVMMLFQNNDKAEYSYIKHYNVGGNNNLSCYSTLDMRVYRNYFQNTVDNNGIGIYAQYGTHLYCYDNYINKHKYGVGCGSLGLIVSKNNATYGNSCGHYGLRAVSGIIIKDSTQPSGLTAPEMEETGGKVFGVDADLSVNLNSETGATYTLASTDANRLVMLNNASPITVTIPTNASVFIPVGTRIFITQTGAGKVTFAGAGITINSKNGYKSIGSQWVVVTLIKTATDTWTLSGDLGEEDYENARAKYLQLHLYDYYYNNTKQIANCEYLEGWVDNHWNNTAGTFSNDLTNYNVGLCATKLTTTADIRTGIHLVKSMDLSTFNDGSASSTSDYISLSIYISSGDLALMEGTNWIGLYLGCDSIPTVTNNFTLIINKASLVAGWNYITAQKSAFTVTGTPNWNAILGVALYLRYADDSGLQITIDNIQLVRKDPLVNAANPFQRYVGSAWERDFYDASNKYFCGLEFGEIVARKINGYKKQKLSVIDDAGTKKAFINISGTLYKVDLASV